MAKRDGQNRAVKSQSADFSTSNFEDINQADSVSDEAKATEVLELAIDDIRLIASAFEIIDLSFQQFPDRFTSSTPSVVRSAEHDEKGDENSRVIIH